MAAAVAAGRRRRPFGRGGLTALLFLLPALVFFVAVIVYPIVYSGYLSLFRWNGIAPRMALHTSQRRRRRRWVTSIRTTDICCEGAERFVTCVRLLAFVVLSFCMFSRNLVQCNVGMDVVRYLGIIHKLSAGQD